METVIELLQSREKAIAALTAANLKASAITDRPRQALAEIEQQIQEATAELIAKAYTAKGEPYGVVNVEVGPFELKADVSKTVKWDQKKLAEKYEQIKSDGSWGDVSEYIKAEYKISETSYKSWPSNLASHFEDARTVVAGKPTLKIERKEA
jgi:hypothetical protein